MSVKSTIDGEENNTTTMADRIAAVQAEPWRRYDFIDSETPEAWKVFNENFFAGGAMGQNTEDLLAKVPKLISGVNDQEYLDMIAPPRDKARMSKYKAKAKAKANAKKDRDLKKGKGKEATIEEDDDSSSTISDPSSGSDTTDDEVEAKAKVKAKA
jgi:DNA-directed RNA polymerase-3 subunit RPC5